MRKELILISLLLSLTACSDTQTSQSKTSSMSVEELLKKTDANMIRVKGGTFMMGDVGGIINGKDEPRATWTTDDDVLHKVTLSDFAMQKYEVTLAEYDVYSNQIKEKRNHDYMNRKRVVPIQTWNKAKDYCLWLAKVSGKHYDLPTEAQWEYTARNGGKRVVFATDDGTYNKGENCDNKLKTPGRFQPNKLGFYDLTGSSREWVNDWYSENYETKEVTNPKGPKNGTKKVSRGDAVSFVDGTNYSRAGLESDAPSLSFRCVENY